MTSRRLSSVLLLVLSLAILAGCSSVRERSFKISEDWSRGNRIGITSIRQPVALAADNVSSDQFSVTVFRICSLDTAPL